MSRLTVKTLRFYHEQGLPEPVRVDSEAGYRYYDDSRLNRAKDMIEEKMLADTLIATLRFKGRILPGGKAVTLVHHGPYAEIGRTYRRVFDYMGERNLRPAVPAREVYLKDPGMLFAGNLRKYLTEVQVRIG